MVEEKIENNNIQFMWLDIRKGSKWKKKELNYLYKFNIKSFSFFREQENRETIDKLDEEKNTNNVSKDKSINYNKL